MLITIFDVDHGFCSLIRTDEGYNLLIDCGHNSSNGFRPSWLLPLIGIHSIDSLIISNCDEDHISDLSGVVSNIFIQSLRTNPSLNEATLRWLKLQTGPISEAMAYLLALKSPNLQLLRGMDWRPLPVGAELNFFWLKYPWFDSTNNLSLVTFMHHRNIHIIFPGDIEVAGWRALLIDRNIGEWFRSELRRVNIFVASHHGRLNGYCREVFGYCAPEIVVISDGARQYATQETVHLYAQHARGIGPAWGRRYVLTTRTDGHIQIQDTAPGYPNGLITISGGGS